MAIATVSAEDVLTSTKVNEIIDAVNDLLPASEPWQTYVPVWTGGSPVLGNGTLTGSYIQVGDWVTAKIKLTAGSTTTFGSTVWSFTLPVTAAASGGDVGSLYILDSTTANRSGSSLVNATTTVFAITSADGDVGPTTPQVWTTNDALVITITYKAA